MVIATFGRLFVAFLSGCVLVAITTAQVLANDDLYFEFSGKLKFESRLFPHSGAYQEQTKKASGFVFEPELYVENSKGWSFNFSPFFRYDNSDSERTHADIREAYVLMFGDVGNSEWEFRLGVDHVFWGVAELTNLVDIVNQTDLVEDPNGKIKLGQMMARFTITGDSGVGELFVLPGHRSRTYPGVKGRLRSALVVDDRLTTYEHMSGDNHIDVAVRYSDTIGSADIGISVFDGTNREPSIRPHPEPTRLIPDPESGHPIPDPKPNSLRPHYEQIRQYGLDVGMTLGDFLLKFEAIRRTGASNIKMMKQDYSSYLVGTEYTFYSVFESNTNVIVLGEWIYDDRGVNSTTALQNDFFVATHINLNDVNGTEFTISYLQDRDYDSKTMTFEARRRLNDEWTMELEAIDFLKAEQADMNQFPIRRDDYVNLSLTYNF